MKIISQLLLLSALFFTGTANAATVTDLYGDKDCFGSGGACVEDGVTWAVSSWSEVIADASDPYWTDRAYSSGETASWTHTIAAGAYDSASISIRTLGMADIRGPYDILIDGIIVGSMPIDGYGHLLSETFTFSFDTSLLLDGIAEVSISTLSGDWWAIDYSEITATSAVPIPAAVWLFGSGLLGLIGTSRRKRAMTAS